jgi:two-component system CheB/CheR fusion protein
MTDSSSPDHAEQDAGIGLDDVVPGRGYELVPLVGLGGSAGSIPALQQFFQSLPGDSGLAFVVVIHLQPEHESQLAELLQRCTKMPVHKVEGREQVQPNSVYVIPPRKLIRAEDGYLCLDEPLPSRSRHVAVDLFFRTLADTHGPHSAAVVLSGADGDGAIGLKRIKERGGLTIAQNPDECEHGSMPRTAIATGMVDWVLPAADIAPRLLAYFRLEKHLKLPAEEAPPVPAKEAGDEALLRDVLAFLRTRTGRDFANYKRATIVRRIARRMQVNGTDNLAGYLNYLRTRPDEAPALLQDLLISVTNFFRDSDCFGALEAHLRDLFRNKGPEDTVRVWVPACATGEEAYSLAISLCDYAREIDAPPLIQVFATDLDEEAIRSAREGVYPTTIEADVSEERLRRYFSKEHRGWRVRREVREMVLFAQHDVLKDSPFSRLDLVSCRNLLIYLNREAQQRVFQTFHFALKPHGLLFLGSSETAEEVASMFGVIDKKHRIYSQRPLPRVNLPVLSGPTTLSLALGAPQPSPEVPSIGGRAFDQPPIPGRPMKPAEGPPASWSDLHFRLLETLAPPSILVDSNHDVMHLSASAGRFLQFAGGEPSRNLLRAVHPDLRIQVRAALYQAQQGGGMVEMMAGPLKLGDGEAEVTIRVWPIQEMGAELFMVTLGAHAPAHEPSSVPERTEADPVARHLDRELERLKGQLRDTVEQYEASTEELKASNEELQAMNEELRSATEELETSREELQSINEELSTVNSELKNKVDELGHANSDIHNLMDATQIATVFLDRDLHIMRYTPPAVALFNLIPSDVGRPLRDLASRLDYPELDKDAQRVLDRLVPIERELGLPDGSWYLTRLLPYRTVEDRIAGIVLSFIDITERKQAEEVRQWLSTVVSASADGIVSFSLDLTVLSWNGACEGIFGYTAQEIIGQSLAIVAPGHEQQQLDNVRRLGEGKPLNFEAIRHRKDGSPVRVSLSVSPIRDHDGQVIGGTAIVRDITESERAREALRASEERLRLVVENAREYAIFSIDLDRRITSWNTGAERILGYSEKEVLGQIGDIIFTEEDRAAGAPEAEMRAARSSGRAADDRFHVRKDGTRFWASGMAMLMRDSTGKDVGFVKILRDQTEERETQLALKTSQQELVQALAEQQVAQRALQEGHQAKDRFLAVLSHELRNPLASIASASELLMTPNLPEAATEKAAQVVQRQSRAMKVLLDDLLDVSRLSLGRLKLARRPVSIGSIVESALETTRPLVQAAGHQLSLQLPAQEIEVNADPLRLSQVVTNLVTNACKYTPEGGKIHVSAEVLDGEVVITVTDNGIGMEATEIDRMFHLFSQGEAAINRSNGGLGIGLALSRTIVEMHEGWIMASSEGPGRGSQLRIGLALLRTAAQRPPSSPAPIPSVMPPAVAAPDTDAQVILVADDNGDAAWGMAKLLELSGFRALLARGGEEAWRLAHQHRPAIALLDIGMPDLSGHDVARRLRATDWGKAMILIAATGWGQEGDVRESLEAGFDAHLTKPLNVGRIKALLDELRAQRRNGK